MEVTPEHDCRSRRAPIARPDFVLERHIGKGALHGAADLARNLKEVGTFNALTLERAANRHKLVLKDE